MDDDEDEIEMDVQDEVVDDDEGISSEEGGTNQARRARHERLDREMADLIKERDKFLATQDPFAKKRISRATRHYQYSDHDDGIYGGNRRGSSSKVDQVPDRRYNHRHRRRRNIQTFPPVYDQSGIHINSGRDICDCLDAQCPGCHDKCEACGSSKCGAECRSGRTWTHQEVIQFHPHKPKEITRSRPV